MSPRLAGIAAAALVGWMGWPSSPAAQARETAALREERLAALQRRAQAHIDGEQTKFTALELEDIEARYRAAHRDPLFVIDGAEGARRLEELAERYPRSNRAGCAVLKLAQRSSGPVREQYLRRAIASHSDTWLESGVQVGALARAMLAVYLAGLDRFDEAERVAGELVMFPGAIDDSGASLDDVLPSIRLLRGKK